VDSEAGLTHDERATLHFIAQRTVECVVRGEDIPLFHVSSEGLKGHRGAFVTLTKEGKLRGCIGCLIGTMPLCDTIKKMAIQAATGDPRFPPLTRQELPSLEIEISVLGPLRPIECIEDIVVGTHGVFIVCGKRSGVLLPQVATQYGWDRRTFLESVSKKAGLPGDAWTNPKARIYVFTAEVF